MSDRNLPLGVTTADTDGRPATADQKEAALDDAIPAGVEAVRDALRAEFDNNDLKGLGVSFCRFKLRVLESDAL